MVWSESDSYGYSDVRGLRVRKSDGAPLDATPLCIACGPGIQYGASVASNGHDFLVAWDAMPGGPTTPRIHGVRVRGADGAVLGPSRQLSSEFPPQFGSAVASDGSNYLVAWQGYELECVYPPRQRPSCSMRRGMYCQACGVAAGGTADGVCGAVRADAAVVCRPSAVACDVAEVCDGASTTCPADEPSASEPDLSGDKCEDTADDVVAFLAALGPEALEPSFGQSLQVKAEAACQSWQRGGAKAAEGQLRALLQQVRAQRGKKLSVSAADTLIAALTGMLGS